MNVIVVLLSIVIATTAQNCRNIPENNRLDCNPDKPISEDVCHKRGCCWVPTVMSLSSYNSSINVSNCFYGPDYVGYEVNNIQNYALKTVVTLNRKISSGFPKDSQIVILEIISLNDYSVQ